MIFIYIMFAFCAICILKIHLKFGKFQTILYSILPVIVGFALVDIYKEMRVIPLIIVFIIFVSICVFTFRKAFGGIRHGSRRFERGSSILGTKDMLKVLNKYKTRIPFGEYKLPIESEVKHCFIIGRPGTGKTNALNQMIAEVRRNELQAIIHDNKGDFVSHFYNKDVDYILNPFDERCIGWNIFNDIKRETDFNLFASSLIPDQPGDPYWYEVPRKILSEVLSYCWHSNKRTNKDLWQTLSLPVEKLAELLRDNNGTSYNDLVGNEKTSSNLMSTLLSKCRIFYYMQHIDGDFSIDDWIKSANNFVFLTNQADIKDTVKPILTLFIDICTSKVLSLPDDRDRRIFFFLDEFGSLAKINNIVNLLTLSRSKGGAVFIGIQDIGNIEKLYGKEHRQTIVNACGNSLIFAVEDPDTAEFLSKKLGDIGYYETMETVQMQGTSTQEQKRSERIILPSQIQQLVDMSCLVKFADIGIGFTKFKYVNWQVSSPAFIEHKKLILSNEKENINNMQSNIDCENTKKAEMPSFESI